MQSITFTCEVITPMFLAGADDSSPELRPASIKGGLRFWWRAMNGHLVGRNGDLTKLKEEEALLFGSTDKKSSFSIRISQPKDLQIRKEIVLPHRENGFQKNAIVVGQQFDVVFQGSNLRDIYYVFLLATILGGLGQRKRRGFGSYQITDIQMMGVSFPSFNFEHISIENIHILLNQIASEKFFIRDNIIHYAFSQKINYPHIEKIEIGRANANLVKKIGKVTHEIKGDVGNYLYSRAIGAANPRLASPISISTIPVYSNRAPIVVTLTNENINKELAEIQKIFINHIVE